MSDPKTVDDEGIASFDRVLKAGQKLQGRNRIAIGIVRVRLQAKVSVGQIIGIDLGPDLEPASVIGHANVAEGLRYLAQIAALFRNMSEKSKSIAADCREPIAQLG